MVEMLNAVVDTCATTLIAAVCPARDNGAATTRTRPNAEETPSLTEHALPLGSSG